MKEKENRFAEKKEWFFVFWCLVIFSFGVGLYGTIPSIWAKLKYLSTDAVILGGRVVDGSGFSSGTGRKYTPQILFRYSVSGKDFTNDRYFLINQSGSLRWAERILEAYPRGSACNVSYNPDNPQESALDLSFPTIALYPILFSLGLALTAIVLSRRKRKRRTKF